MAADPPPEIPGEPLDLVGKVRLAFARFSALGGIPEACDLAWKLCCENEELKKEIAALRAAGDARPQPIDHESLTWLLAHARVLLEREHHHGEKIDTCEASACVKWRTLSAAVDSQRSHPRDRKPEVSGVAGADPARSVEEEPS